MAKNKKPRVKKGIEKTFFREPFIKGNLITRLSLIVFGLGNFAKKQFIQGLLLLAVEVGYIVFMIVSGVNNLANIVTLGTVQQTEVWNEAKGIYEYSVGDNSMLFLLYGVLTIFATIAFVLFAVVSMRCAYAAQVRDEAKQKQPNVLMQINSLKDKNLHTALLTLPTTAVIILTIIPIVFMILIAFTNYDRNHQPPGNLFTWVGFDNFATMLSPDNQLGQTFWPILGWTLIWAIFATFTNFILGTILAMFINSDPVKAKGFWRFLFVMSIAVPQFVSLLTMKTIFNPAGPLNTLLLNMGVIGEPIQFFSDPLLAKITIIVVNIWIGIPFTMLTSTGILKNIPADLYEAARMDGAGPVTIFFKITMPYMMFVMTPHLITSFVGNINNFNVIYLLTGGAPDSLDYYSAGKTDLLITWLYKLTITQKDYNLGSVIGILVFVIMATLSLLTYRNTGSYKNEEGFQ